MKLHFYGADRCVTGSCHCLEINGKKILVDCGLQQGRDELDNRYLAFAPGSIDILLVTHAHIDHTGRIPLLVKNGFHGRILTTRVTADLMKIMLLDSAHIQESDAEYENRKGQRAGREPVEPLYTEQDALDVFKYVTTCEYEEKINLCEGVSAVFTDAGHLLGSASITLELEENGVHKTLVFSGDIGNVDQPIIRDPQLLKKADYVVMESTYGDRNHTEVWSYTDELAEIIDETLGKGGNVVIPSFAVGRTQELLYFIREIKDQKLVKSTPNFPVYIDSPLAKAATTVFCGDLHGYLDEQALDLVKDGTHMFTFPNLNLVESSEESKMLNMDTTPKVIISASGMCDAGRIRHHLKHNLWRANSAVVFVVHGDEDVAPVFAEELNSLSFHAHAAKFTECYDLAANEMVSEGYISERKRTAQKSRADNLYAKLVAAAESLLEFAKRCKGRPNKDISALTGQIISLIERFRE